MCIIIRSIKRCHVSKRYDTVVYEMFKRVICSHHKRSVKKERNEYLPRYPSRLKSIS